MAKPTPCTSGGDLHTFAATLQRGVIKCRDCGLTATLEQPETFIDAVRRTYRGEAGWTGYRRLQAE